MTYTYEVLPDSAMPMLYSVLKAENTLWALWPENGMTATEQEFCASMTMPDKLVLGGYIDGTLAGILTLTPFGTITQCGEVGLTAFRKYFSFAAPLCRSALMWCYDHMDLRSMIGRVACPNRHILHMLGDVGFSKAALLPGLVWYERQQKFVDGWLVTATRESVERSMK